MLVALTSVLLVVPAHAQSSNEFCERAIKAYRAGDVEQARDCLLSALAKHSANDQVRVNILDNLRLMYEKLGDDANERATRQAYQELDQKLNPSRPPELLRRPRHKTSVQREDEDEQPRRARVIKVGGDEDREKNMYGFMDITDLVSGGITVTSGGTQGTLMNKSNYYFLNVIIVVEVTKGSGEFETDTISVDGLPPNATKDLSGHHFDPGVIGARILRVSGKRVQ